MQKNQILWVFNFKIILFLSKNYFIINMGMMLSRAICKTANLADDVYTFFRVDVFSLLGVDFYVFKLIYYI